MSVPGATVCITPSETLLVSRMSTGMSIGSIATGDFVSGVVFSHNTVSNSMYGTRIKAQSAATSGAVTNVTWTGYAPTVSLGDLVD